jgi:maltose alpha-D-glucosyltransferase/alpha-amylase
MLGLARQDARPIAATLRELPALPRHGQWATFLRNRDEVDLGRLTPEERQGDHLYRIR